MGCGDELMHSGSNSTINMEDFEISKLVQEIAITGGDPPSRYVQCKDHGASSTPSPVPVIDLSRLSKSDSVVEAAKLKSAAESWGLFIATGHGIPFTLLDEVLNVTKELFDLPVEERQLYTDMKDGKHYQFEGFGNDPVLANDQILDWTDRLYLVVHPEEKRDLSLWPKVPESFRDTLQELTVKCKQIGGQIARIMAMQLGLNEDYILDEYLDEKAEIAARFSYYPQCTRPEKVFGIKPHSDGSVVTILLLDKDVSGLQALKDNEWVEIPTLCHSLLVIFGDHMEMISNGIVKSPLHRVLTNAEKPRISVVMFYQPGPEKELKPADALVNAERPSLYNKVTVKGYTSSWFDRFAKTGGRTVDLFKVEHEG